MQEASRVTKYLVLGASFLAVPAVLCLDFATKGAILPHLPGRGNTWNVQYMLHFGVSISMLAILFVSRRRAALGGVWYWLAVVWNLAFAALFLHAVVTLWGEKY